MQAHVRSVKYKSPESPPVTRAYVGAKAKIGSDSYAMDFARKCTNEHSQRTPTALFSTAAPKVDAHHFVYEAISRNRQNLRAPQPRLY